MNLNDTVKDVTLSKVCRLKADKDSTEIKQVTIKCSFDGVKLADVFNKALAGAVIQWQNGPGRKNFTSWKNNQEVEIKFKAPAAQPQIDPMTALLNEAKAKGIDVTDKVAMTQFMMDKLNA